MIQPSDLSSELWEPMETAPLDETPIRVRNGDLQATVSWSNSIRAWVIGLATEPELCDRILRGDQHRGKSEGGAIGLTRNFTH
jgi:hypothetical protein